jgi:hypothetical protein
MNIKKLVAFAVFGACLLLLGSVTASPASADGSPDGTTAGCGAE